MADKIAELLALLLVFLLATTGCGDISVDELKVFDSTLPTTLV